MENQAIAETLEELADLLEIRGEAVFKLRAYRNGAKVIGDLAQPLAELVRNGTDLTTLDGIGKSLAEKCEELVRTGRLQALEDVLVEIPRSVLDLARVPKVGPKKASALFRNLGIRTLDQLRAACEAHKVRELDGFGEKTEQAILKGIPAVEAASQCLLWVSADQIVQRLLEHMRRFPGLKRMEIAGSYRRGKETVGDLDLLTVPEAGGEESLMDHFASWEEAGTVQSRGPTRMSLRTQRGLQVDLRVIPAESFGAALQYFTGSKEHNIALRRTAKRIGGWKLNEYGLFDEAGVPVPDAAANEETLYRTLGLSWVPPELREDRGELDAAAAGKLPGLIRRSDIRGDLHMHTTATDGRNSIAEMVAAARNRGLQYIAITDHSRRVTMARGLDPERLLAQWREIDELNREQADGFRILKGIECDILEAGGMDLPDDVLCQADWVIASLHYGQSQSRAQITDRIVGALRNPHVWIVAHPTGRRIGHRPPYDVDLTAVFQAAAEHRKFLELNSSPSRLDLDDTHLMAARKFGIPIVISTDAHHTEGLGDLRFGILQARRAWLEPSAVANTLAWEDLRALAGRS